MLDWLTKWLSEIVHLLERYEPRGVSSADTRSTVLHRLVGDGELSKVVSNHLGLDFDLVEGLAVVDSHNASNHLWHNDHVPEVSLDHGGFFQSWGFLLGLAQTFHQSHWFTLESTSKPPPYSAVKQLHQLLIVHVQQLVQVDTAKCVLPEHALLLLLCQINIVSVRHFLK